MKITIIGPGAMGCLFAARLSQAGIKTTLVDYRPERAARLRDAGVTIETETETYTAHPSVATEVPAGQGLIMVMTKAYVTQTLRFPSGVPILTLQNGLGNVETICAAVGSANVLAGTTYEAAHMPEEGRVRHVASGLTPFGAWTSCDPQPAADALAKAGFDVAITDSPGQLIWEKVVLNSAINPLSALLDLPNGRLIETAEVRQLLRDLVVEAAKVAATEGYRFDHSLVEQAERVCRQTADNISSMLQDVRAKRRTEADAIIGEILERAQAAGLPAPRTRVIWQLLMGIENR